MINKKIKILIRVISITALLSVSSITLFAQTSRVPSQGIPSTTNPSATDILRASMKALSNLSAVEYEVEADEQRSLLSYKMTKVRAKTTIIAANSPRRAFARLQGADGATYETFTLNGNIMPYSAAGAVGENDLSKAFKPLTAFADFARTEPLLLNREFFAKIIEDGRLLYGGQEIIGDDLCDVIVHVKSNLKQNVIDTNYYWISTKTNLPRAKQSLSMTKRGKTLSPQFIINVTKQNPTITPATFAYKPTEKDSVAPPESNDDVKIGNSGDRELTNLIGKQLPFLILNDTSFQKLKLGDIINKPTLITLWATWCAPCLKEMPFFQKMVDKHKGKFQVLAVATSEDDPRIPLEFIKKHPEYKFTFLLDPDAARKISLMKEALGSIDALPINLLVDGGGKIVSGYLGERKEAEWAELIDKLVTK